MLHHEQAHAVVTSCQITGKPVQNFICDPKLMEFVKKEFVVNGIKGFGDV
jgi:pyridoxal/pyridoxine/pyridoxamine kinase